MRSGWFRLWVVFSCTLVLAVVSVAGYYVWRKDICYTFVSVSIADNTKQQDLQLAEAMKKEATERTFCGVTQYSPILTIEDLAKRGVVTQVGVSWKEPNGWSFKDHDMLDVIDKNDIKAAEIIGRVSSYVHNARMRYVSWFVAASVIASVAILILGIAIGWIRRGFQNGSA